MQNLDFCFFELRVLFCYCAVILVSFLDVLKFCFANFHLFLIEALIVMQFL